MSRQRRRTLVLSLITLVMTLLMASGAFYMARGADPIKIGFGMALTGGLSANGKPALLAMQIWKDDINKKGGLAGPPGRARLLRRPDQPAPPSPASTASCSTSTRSTSSCPAMAPT